MREETLFDFWARVSGPGRAPPPHKKKHLCPTYEDFQVGIEPDVNATTEPLRSPSRVPGRPSTQIWSFSVGLIVGPNLPLAFSGVPCRTRVSLSHFGT